MNIVYKSEIDPMFFEQMNKTEQQAYESQKQLIEMMSDILDDVIGTLEVDNVFLPKSNLSNLPASIVLRLRLVLNEDRTVLVLVTFFEHLSREPENLEWEIFFHKPDHYGNYFIANTNKDAIEAIKRFVDDINLKTN